MTSLQPQRLWTKSFVLITISYLLLFMCLQMLLSPMPSYAQEQFGAGSFTVSLATGLFALAAIAARFMTAALMRNVNRNVLLLIGVSIAALATALYPTAGSMTMLLLLRILFGIGFGMTSTVLPTIVTPLIPKSRLGEGIGYFGLSTSLAMSIGPMVGLNVLTNYGFPTLSMMGAISALAILPLLFGTRCLPPAPARAATVATTVANGSGNSSIYSRIWLPALLNMLTSITYGGILGFMALFGAETGLANVGLFFLCNAFTVLAIRPISGRVFDRYGHVAVLVPAAILVGASLLLLSRTESLPLLIVSALLYGLGFGSIQPTTQAWMLRQSSPERHSSVNSLYYNSIDFGVAIGSMLLGALAARTGYAGMYAYAASAMGLFLAVYALAGFASRGKLPASSRVPLQ